MNRWGLYHQLYEPMRKAFCFVLLLGRYVTCIHRPPKSSRQLAGAPKGFFPVARYHRFVKAPDGDGSDSGTDPHCRTAAYLVI